MTRANRSTEGDDVQLLESSTDQGPLNGISLAGLYTLFAVVATVTNIATQELWLRLGPSAYALAGSILAGTVAGLLVKYVLDKQYIFRDKTAGVANNTRMFIMYSAMGVITTVVFWGFELAFEFLFQTKFYRYLGGVIGLAIGYWLKYQLDRRFVFSQEGAS